MTTPATYWTKEPQQAPLYSDWIVSFTTTTTTTTAAGKKDINETGSVSTASLSSASSDGESSSVVTSNSSDVVVSTLPSPPSSSPASSSQEQQQQQQQPSQSHETSFAVHRNMIGPRSEYFTKSFLSMTSSSSKSHENNMISVITLPSNLSKKAFNSLVEAFEVFLDYCYTPTSTTTASTGTNDFTSNKLTTDNAVAMYCLCNYFQMDNDVCAKVQNFISNDLNQDTVVTYYQNIKELRSSSCDNNNNNNNSSTTPTKGSSVDNKDTSTSSDALLNVSPLHEMVAHLCYKHPNVLSPSSVSNLTKIADLALWLSIGSLLSAGNITYVDDSNDDHNKNDNNISMKNDSKIWSENLTTFFDNYYTDNSNDSTDSPSLMNLKESFRILTNDKVLPVVSEKVALRLLQHEREHDLCDANTVNDEHEEKDYGTVGTLSFGSSADESDDDDESDESDSLNSVVEAALNSVIDAAINSSEDKEEDEQEQPSSSLCKTTNLQRRCIKALADSNWGGEENDIVKLRNGRSLTQITTPVVLEELLIESVIGERKLGPKLNVLKEEMKIEKQLRIDQNSMNDQHLTTIKVELVKEQQKHHRLTKVLEDEAEKREIAELKLTSFDSKLEEEKNKLRSINRKLEAKLEEQKNQSYGLNLRYGALESALHKTEADREMLELTCRETIARLEAMSNQGEWWNNACGVMSPLILMLSTMSDRGECEKIRSMLQEVVVDPSCYERNFLLKNIDEDGDDVTCLTREENEDIDTDDDDDDDDMDDIDNGQSRINMY